MLTNLPPYCAVVMKAGNLNFLEPSGSFQACNGTALTFYFLTVTFGICYVIYLVVSPLQVNTITKKKLNLSNVNIFVFMCAFHKILRSFSGKDVQKYLQTAPGHDNSSEKTIFDLS